MWYELPSQRLQLGEKSQHVVRAALPANSSQRKDNTDVKRAIPGLLGMLGTKLPQRVRVRVHVLLVSSMNHGNGTYKKYKQQGTLGDLKLSFDRPKDCDGRKKEAAVADGPDTWL